MALVLKNLPANAGDAREVGSIPGSGRSPGGGHGNPLQYSCLGNPMDRGAWQATVLRVAKSRQDLAKDTVYLHVKSLRWQFKVLRLLLCMCFSHLVLPAGPEGGRAGSKLPPSLMCRGFKDLLVLSTSLF